MKSMVENFYCSVGESCNHYNRCKSRAVKHRPCGRSNPKLGDIPTWVKADTTRATTGKELFINRLVDLIAKEIRRRKVGRLAVTSDVIRVAQDMMFGESK